MQTERQREAFLALTSRSVPAFAAPLYIGVAKNLRTRLRTHKAVLLDQEWSMDGGTSEILHWREPLLNHGRGTVLPVDRLRILASEIELEGLSPDEARQTAEAAERFLNQTDCPLFGRR